MNKKLLSATIATALLVAGCDGGAMDKYRANEVLHYASMLLIEIEQKHITDADCKDVVKPEGEIADKLNCSIKGRDIYITGLSSGTKKLIVKQNAGNYNLVDINKGFIFKYKKLRAQKGYFEK